MKFIKKSAIWLGFYLCLCPAIFSQSSLPQLRNSPPDAYGSGPVWFYGHQGLGLGEKSYIEDLNGDGLPDLIKDWSSVLGVCENTGLGLKNTGIYGAPDHLPSHNFLSLESFTPLYGSPAIGVLFESSVIGIFEPDCENPMELIELQADIPFIKDLKLFDIDGDDKYEFVVTNGTSIFIVNSQPPYQIEREISAAAGDRILIAQVDDDPEFEILTHEVDTTYVLSATGKIEWTLANSWSEDIQVHDIDQDQKDELIIARSDLRVFDVDTQTLKWEVENVGLNPADALGVGDIDDDQIPEVIFGESSLGNTLYIYDAMGNLKWSMPYPGRGVTAILVRDMNQDGINDIIYNPGRAAIHFLDPQTQLPFWQSDPTSGPFSPVAMGDLNQDGMDELIAASFSSFEATRDGIIHVFDMHTREIQMQINDLPNLENGQIWSVNVGDLEQDGAPELMVAVNDKLQIYNGQTLALKDQITIPNETVLFVVLADVDADKTLELVVGTWDRGSDFYLRVLNAEKPTIQEWISPPFEETSTFQMEIKVANIDHDPQPEIVFATSKALVILDGLTKQQEFLLDFPAISLELADLDEDQALEVIVSSNRGWIVVIDGASHAIEFSQEIFDRASISYLEIDDFNGDGELEWLFVAYGQLFLYKHPTQAPIWKSSIKSSLYGSLNQLVIKDQNQDGIKEIIIGSNHGVVELIPIPSCGPIPFLNALPQWDSDAINILELMAIQDCINACL